MTPEDPLPLGELISARRANDTEKFKSWLSIGRRDLGEPVVAEYYWTGSTRTDRDRVGPTYSLVPTDPRYRLSLEKSWKQNPVKTGILLALWALVSAHEVAAEPVPTVKGSFVSIYYFLNSEPSTTTGNDATWNSETNTVTFYEVFSKGNFKGRRIDYQCRGRIFFEIKDGAPIEIGPMCDTKMLNGLPVTTTVTDSDDGFVHVKTTFQF